MTAHDKHFCVLALMIFVCTTLVPLPAAAESAYRMAVTSNPQSDPLLRLDGLTVTLRMDEARCKKEYGKEWFRQCVAAPAGEAGRLVPGVKMTPHVEGSWRWENDDTMRFTPSKGSLAPATKYAISLDNVSLPQRFSLNRHLTYTTLPQAVSVGKETLWIDPSVKGAHAVSVPLRFVWPVLTRNLEEHISIAPTDTKSGLSFAPPRFIWNERRDEVVVSAQITSLPENNAAARVSIAGLPAFTTEAGKCVLTNPGKNAPRDVTAMFSVPGVTHIMDVKDIVIRPACDDQLNKTYELEITTTMHTLPSEILQRLTLIALPLKLSEKAGKPADWTRVPAISADDIQKGTKLQGEPLQPLNEATDRLVLRLDAEAGRGLLAAVDEGLPSIAGPKTAKVRRFILNVPSIDSEVGFLQPGNVLTLSGQKKLDIYATGVTSLHWRIERVRDPFLALAAKDSSFEDLAVSMEVMGDAVEGRIDLSPKSQGAASFPVLDLAPLLKNGTEPTHGLMRVTLRGYNGNKQVAQNSRLLLITDMGLIVKQAANNGRTVFVQHLAKGVPVEGVEVRLLSANGTTAHRVLTDAQGRADLPQTPDLRQEKRPVAIVATAKTGSGEDLAWISLDDSQRLVDFSNFAISGRHTTQDGLSASVFSQRGLYLPGETLHFGCLVRRYDWQPLPQDLPLEAVLVSPTGSEVLRHRFSVGHDGFNSLDWKSDEDSPVGAYQLDIRLAGSKANSPENAVLGSARVRLEEFQPDTLALTAQFAPGTPRGWIRTGTGAPDVWAQARLDNLYGEVAVNHRVKAVLRTEKSHMRFPGYEDFTFYEPSGFEGEGQTIELPDAYTDDKGTVRLSLPLNSLSAGTQRGAILLEGFEPAGGRAVTRRLEAIFSPLEVALGYKPEGKANNLDYVPQNAKASLRLLALDNELVPVNLSHVEVVFSARRYVNSLMTDSNGAYRYEATPVDTEISRNTVQLGNQGLSLPLPTNDAGEYLLTIRHNGLVLAMIPYTVAGMKLAQPEGLSPTSLAKGDLRIKLDKSNYAPGEIVKLRLSTPFEGTGLITVERESVVAQTWFTAQPGESVQEIRLPDDFQGRGYINVSYARAMDSQEIYMAPHAAAVAPFTVGLDQRDMNLAFNVPTHVLPGGVITARLTADVPGRALVFAVDEGVLQLTDFATPDPLHDLLLDRALDVSTLTAFDLLMPDHARLQGRIPGFGGGMAGPGGRFLNPFKRRGEPPFAFWHDIVPVDKNGTEVRLTVPEYVSGKIRLMAVGSAAPQNGDSRAGHAEAFTEVRGTLILKPLLPLAVTPGDIFEAAVVVANTLEGSGKKAPVNLSLKSTGGLSFVDNPTPTTLMVDENGEATLRFRMKADDTLGEASVNITATLANVKKGANSSVRTQTVSVRPPVPRLRTENVTVLHGPTVVDVPRDIHTFEAVGQASVAAMPVLTLRSLLARLKAYPYGCTEQLVSRALPYATLLGMPEMRKDLLISPDLKPEALHKYGNAAINAALVAIGNTSSYNGVSLWPGSETNDFVTAYAADFLVTLHESGAATPGGLADSVLNALERLVGRQPANINDARIKLYGAWVLQRDGRIMTQELERLEQWFRNNTRGWETDVAAAFLADSRHMLRLRRQAGRTMPKSVNTNDDPFLSTAAARAFYALMVLKHFPEKKQDIPLLDLMDGAFSTNATTVDMALAARTLLILQADATAELENVSLSCARYGQGFPTGSNKAVMQGSAIVLDAPGCLQYKADMPAAATDLHLLVTTEGFDRKAPTDDGGNKLELHRRYCNARGETVTSASLGEVLTVELTVQAVKDIHNVVLVDLLPGGFEPILEKDREQQPQDGLVRFERREDRAIFFTNLNGERQVFTHKVRATTRGRFILPSATGSAMYDPAINAYTGSGTVSIE
ncbi:MAG: hypothetical protein J5861_06965 [Desulfovibrio sp.]|nr:hypothetical protein [Desulfovibrio sp.]